jgi:hypothetical protein
MSFFAAALASAIVTIISLNTKEGFGGLEAVWLAYVTAPEESKVSTVLPTLEKLSWSYVFLFAPV